jgi:Domain of unknown function (DUF5919)
VRNRLPGERLHLAVYDETIRFNLILSGDHTWVAQAYLPKARGVDAPTMLIRATGPPGGLFPVFDVDLAIERQIRAPAGRGPGYRIPR